MKLKSVDQWDAWYTSEKRLAELIDAIRAEARGYYLEQAADNFEHDIRVLGIGLSRNEIIKRGRAAILFSDKPRFVEGELVRDKVSKKMGKIVRVHDDDLELENGDWIIGRRAESVHVEIIDGRAIVREADLDSKEVQQ